MKFRNYFSKNENETSEIAAKIAQELKGGELIALDGDLGAGKTFFTGALCSKLNIERKFISSPTYVIMKKYDGIFTVFHWDFYRLSSIDELFTADFHEYLKMNGSITIIEWASLFKKSWEDHFPRIEVKINFGKNINERNIEIKKFTG